MADILLSSERYSDPEERGRRLARKVPEEAEQARGLGACHRAVPQVQATVVQSHAHVATYLPDRSGDDNESGIRLVSEDISRAAGGKTSYLVLSAVAVCVGCIVVSVAVLVALLRPAPAAACRQGGAEELPAGTNFGGWLVLEDWFFSGQEGRYVMTVDPRGQGACLPPELRGSGEPWPSEGILTQRLNDTYGSLKTVDIFTAHRHSFIGEQDLHKLAELGIRHVRVPLTWAAFADALAPISPTVYGSHNASGETVVVPDPYYAGNASLVTVPRAWLEQLLRRAAGYGLRLLFDLHAMPGGSSDGTYNGVWPNEPQFWRASSKIGNTAVTLSTAGLWVAGALIRWVEGLDEELQQAVLGLTLMNEPAHMSASQGFAQPEAVLRWLEEAADLFRRSALPGRGVKLYVNMIETSIANFWPTVAPWWSEKFSVLERQTWAVFDVHWYTAWSDGRCDGRVLPGGGYFCDQPLEEVRQLLRGCAGEYVEVFSSNIEGLKACSEFSVGTFADAVIACNDKRLLQMFMEEQASTFRAAGVEAFFWTWRMPYGPTFQMGWSLKLLLGEEQDRLQHPCSLPLGVM